MTTHIMQFVELSDQDRKAAKAFDKLGKGDRVEVLVRRKSGEDHAVRLPPKAAALLSATGETNPALERALERLA
ncbi:hypothetical protein GGD63_005280 [Bradyrhizobium sp. cir1]|uniref:hypothetical protein n=1 Tax=Bradyrhizobium sp. cir1 TaxID=1445730 RepID=UPI0016058331|nr:hypothetical protein [Bradyrhizobium sp. cir1]MBB4372472.1 hypothetical protein [Bradyrhizobium sp. cir1]